MKVIMVVHESPLEITGGAQVYAKSLAEALFAEGHEPAIFSMGSGTPDGDFLIESERDGVKYFTVNKSRLSMPKKTFKFFDTYQNKEVADIFETLVSRFKPDLVHVHHLILLSGEIVHSLKDKGIPVVVTLHDYWFLCHRINLLFRDLSPCTGPRMGTRCHDCGDVRYSTWPGRLLFPAIHASFIHRVGYLRKTLLAADVIISPSQALKDIHAQNRIPADRIKMSTYGIKDILFLYDYKDKPVRTFGYFGTLQPHKGLDYLVEAFNGLADKNAELKIYGAGDSSYRVALRSTASNPRISFHEMFSHEQLPEKMAEIDAVILPSIWEENSPVSLHEARAMRIPILASNIGGIPEIVQHGVNGLLFEPRSAESIRESVLKVLADPTILRSMSLNSGMVKHFRDNVGELFEIYGRLCRLPPKQLA